MRPAASRMTRYSSAPPSCGRAKEPAGEHRAICCAAIAAALLFAADYARAQSASLTGNISALVDYLPDVPRQGAAGRRPVTELRLRAIADVQIEAQPWLRFRLAGVADGLAADRGGAIRAARADALEAWVDVSGATADLRIGMGRLAWGRLDEVQPTDVINPIDVARYLMDGRSEARIAVPLVRGRVRPSENLSVEAVLVPVFRRGRFDRLDEETSPFNLFNDLPGALTFERDEPDAGELQGGGRLSVTSGRVDWSLSAWRGFIPFALVGPPDTPAPGVLRLENPRYTMFGADVETVVGQWALRAEAAFFPSRPLQVENEPRWFEGNSLEAGAGVDRRAGDYTLSGTLLFRRTDAAAGPVRTSLSSVSVVAGFSRTFNRDRIETRVFSLINPEDRAAFVRGVFAWKPADDLAVETSAGWFIGEGDDVITRFGDRDFVYARVKYYFGR